MISKVDNFFKELCNELEPFINDKNNHQLSYYDDIEQFALNAGGIKEKNWINISSSYEALLEKCLKDNMPFEQITKVSDILISKVSFPMQGILKSVGRSKLSAAQDKLNIFCSSVLQEVDTLSMDKELQHKIGPANANNLLEHIANLQNIYESAEPSQKYKILRSELKKLQEWSQTQEKQIENPNLSKIGTFISSAFQKLYCHMIGDKDGVTRHNSNMSQISEELSGSKKTFAKGLVDIKQKTSSFISKIKEEKKLGSNRVNRR